MVCYAYQQLIIYNAAGNIGASRTPSRNLMPMSEDASVAAAVVAETADQTKAVDGMYMLGRTRVRSMLDGT